MGMGMVDENRKNGYEVDIARMGMGMGMNMGHTRPIPVISIPPCTCIIRTPYKTHICLFKVLICYLYLNILLVALNYMIFQTSAEHFV